VRRQCGQLRWEKEATAVAQGSAAANGRKRETERWGRRDRAGRFFSREKRKRQSERPRPKGRGRTDVRMQVFSLMENNLSCG
jgi:hypothetical protein